jgi:hypothetical protein
MLMIAKPARLKLMRDCCYAAVAALVLTLSMLSPALAVGSPGRVAHDERRAGHPRRDDTHAGHRRKRTRRTHHKKKHSTKKPHASKPGPGPAGLLLGDSFVEAQHAYLIAGRSRAFRFRASASGPAGQAYIYVDEGNTASGLILKLYSNAKGRPGRVLSVGSIDLPAPGVWNMVPLAHVLLKAGRTYWLAVVGEDGVLRYRDRHRGSCTSQASLQTTLGSTHVTWARHERLESCSMSAYVTRLAETSPVEASMPLRSLAPVGIVPLLTLPGAGAPSNTALPTISGAPLKGEVLTASSGEWTEAPTSYSYQWQACEASGEHCSDVEGATAETYALGSGDVGSSMQVLVTAANATGAQTATSSPTAVVQEPPPTSTSPPAISGAALEGEVLSVTEGEWTENPTSYSYQWQRCDTTGGDCSNVTGAIAATHTLGSADVGHELRVVVKATDAGGTGSADSNLTSVVEEPPAPPPAAPKNISLPTISGTTTVGQVLSASVGSWSGSSISYSYQWQRCSELGGGCSSIGGATARTYTLGSTDVGHTLRMVVKATDADGTGSADSSVTSVVEEPPALPPAPPTYTSLPTISGTTTQGDVLSATKGSWTGNPTSFSYQWQRCEGTGGGCANVGGVTASTYSLGTGDVGHKLRVVVSAMNAGGKASAISAESALVKAPPPPPPANTSLPTITGSASEGQTLSATNGAWSGSPTSYTYQWQDCNSSGAGCGNISGATGSSRTLSSGDVDHTLRVVVTAHNSGGASSATSVATAVVAGATPSAPANTALPTISGAVIQGQSLSTTNGSWSGSPTSFTYQWQRCNTTGASCSSVGGATTSSYALTSSDVGDTMRVAVTASNAGGSTTATSGPSGQVSSTSVSCTTTIGSGLQTAITNAAAGSTICLDAGSYGEIELSTKKSSMVTITPAPGVSQSQAVLGYTDVTTSSDLTFKGLTIAGDNNGSASTPATHIHWIGDAFTSGVCIHAPTSANIDVLVESSTFIDISSGGCGNEGRLEVNGDNTEPSGTNGVVISDDLFQGASPGGCTDGVNITGGASGTQIGPGDEFSDIEQGSCDPAHVDPIQFYGAPNTTVTGDYFHGDSSQIESPDGNGSPMTVTNNVFVQFANPIQIGGGEGDVINHNTIVGDLEIGHENVGASSNETITNNVIINGIELNGGQSESGWKVEYNLIPGGGGGAHGSSGSPIFVGGAHPSTWAGYALTSGSPGHLAASDGTDMGSNYFGP